jgi:hypothetical protein
MAPVTPETMVLRIAVFAYQESRQTDEEHLDQNGQTAEARGATLIYMKVLGIGDDGEARRQIDAKLDELDAALAAYQLEYDIACAISTRYDARDGTYDHHNPAGAEVVQARVEATKAAYLAVTESMGMGETEALSTIVDIHEDRCNICGH